MRRLFYFLLPFLTLTSSLACLVGGEPSPTQEEVAVEEVAPSEEETPSQMEAESQIEPTATVSLLIMATAPPEVTIDKAKVAAALSQARQLSSSNKEGGDTFATPTAEPTPAPIAPPTDTPKPTPEPILAEAMILIPVGPFIFGSNNSAPDESPAQSIDLPAFEIDQYEVTNDDFAQFVAATGYETYAEKLGQNSWRVYAAGKGDHPVVKVSWDDAQAFCSWAGKRLPTEMEWEKAARGTDGRLYPWGNTFDPSLAKVKGTGPRGITAVGSFPDGVSPYGVADMSGNVWEWTASWFQAYPGNTSGGELYGEQYRVTRGGAWFEAAAQVTTFNRNFTIPTGSNDDLGFRCAR